VFTKDVPSDRFFNEAYAVEYPGGRQVPTTIRLHRRLKHVVFKFLCGRSARIQLLDLGCNQGDLLQTVQGDRRFEVVGIDLAEAPLERKRRAAAVPYSLP
jgi:2-polyprenyl-3-methyl-5-hydroxy-6-metoxy-1,4-benzoquinol methylase